MTIDKHFYCCCCQTRLKKNEGFMIKDREIVSKVNKAKPSILNSKKETNGDVKLNDIIHFKCSLKVNSLVKKNEDIISSLIDTHVESTSSFENFNEENQIVTITSNTSQYKSPVLCENENQTTNSKNSEGQTTNHFEVKLKKGYNSHKKCFVCKSDKKKCVK
jgi:hypothetical protein